MDSFQFIYSNLYAHGFKEDKFSFAAKLPTPGSPFKLDFDA